jgi:hypothetical protein
MKKSLLFSFALGYGLTALAQGGASNSHVINVTKTNQYVIDNMKGVPFVQVNKVAQPVTPHTQAGGIVIRLLGQESNAFGTSGGSKQYLWANPLLNTIILTHRVVVGSNTGGIGYDVSKDGGKTWVNNLGPVYSPDGDPKGLTASTARYPQGVIYNPAGNVIADSAYMAYFAPTRDNSNPQGTQDWGGTAHGVNKLGGLPNPTQKQVSSDAATHHVIPEDMCITKTGVIFNLDPNQPAATSNYDLNDSLIVSRGVFNPSTHDFTTIKMYEPASLNVSGTHDFANCKISMADDGLHGYISSIEHLDFAHNADSAYSLVVHTTADGGLNWGPAIFIDLTDVDTFLLQGHNRYTAGFDHDAVVDGNGNLHMALAIGHFTSNTTDPNYKGFAIDVARNHFGMFDVYTTDMGITWKARLLGKPQTFSGSFGVSATDATNPTITEYNRIQASREYTNGKQVFFTWFDSDSALSAGANTYPNMFSVGFDVTTKTWTNAKNFTAGTAADGKIIQGSASYYIFNTTPGVYGIPVCYSGFKGADPTKTGLAVQLNYIDSAQFLTADFINVDNSYPLTTAVIEFVNHNLAISQNYPNPCSNLTNIDVTLIKGDDLSIEVVNALGQVVSVQQHKSVSPGAHTFTIDLSNLNSGIYFYTVKTADSSITRKLSVN